MESRSGPAKGSQPLPDSLQFDYGETLHFFTTPQLYQDAICLVLDNAEARTVLEGDFSTLVTDGGPEMAWGGPEGEFWNRVEEVDRRITGEQRMFPETIDDDDEVLDVGSGDVFRISESDIFKSVVAEIGEVFILEWRGDFRMFNVEESPPVDPLYLESFVPPNAVYVVTDGERLLRRLDVFEEWLTSVGSGYFS